MGLNPEKVDIVEEIIRYTNGYGTDSVIITAASKSSLVINQAVGMCRKKARIVVVGDIPLDIERKHFYEKELDLLISTSYGPGRYDEKYELRGCDYPYAYVRWTENRNMQEYLNLLSEKKINAESIIERIYPIEEASKAYEELTQSNGRPLIVLLEYNKDSIPQRKIITAKYKIKHDRINVGIIGAGGFTRAVHLPNLEKLSNIYSIYAVCCKTGSNAERIARQYNAAYAATEYKEILNDNEIDMVLISTRHNLHAQIVIDAAKSGEAIFVEKPMALNEGELNNIAAVLKKTKVPFMVGFNRRFSLFALKIKDVVSNRINPMIINYRMNAGFIPREHWVHTEEGGGRNIGEACHIYDLFNYFTESEVSSVNAFSINPKTEQFGSNDNFVATIKYKDGSVCNLIYTAMGTKDYPKEQMKIYFDGKIIFLNDYEEMKIYGVKGRGLGLRHQDKGHLNEIQKFAESINNGSGYPIPLRQLIQATEISFEVEKQIHKY